MTVRVRRAPRFGVFLVLGGLAGVLASLIVVTAGGGAPQYTVFTSFTYFAAIFIVGGIFLGAVVALVTEWSLRRRARNVKVLGSFAPTADTAESTAAPEDRSGAAGSEMPDAATAAPSDVPTEPDAATAAPSHLPTEPDAVQRQGDGGHTNMGH